MRNRFLLAVILVLGLFAGTGWSQIKIGYVNRDLIMEKYEGAKEVKDKLAKQQAAIEQDFSKRYKDIRDLESSIDKQSLLLSAERKKMLQDSLNQLLIQVRDEEQKKFGQGGEWYKKVAELYDPVTQKINTIIQKIAKDENYDFIFDSKSEAILYSLPKYDLTEKVVAILNKEK